MTEEKRIEINFLLERGAFSVILREDVLPDGNVLRGRFVLAIKSNSDENIKLKSRYVIGGHKDKIKHYIVHSAENLHPQSIRLLFVLATMKNSNFRLQTCAKHICKLQKIFTLNIHFKTCPGVRTQSRSILKYPKAFIQSLSFR